MGRAAVKWHFPKRAMPKEIRKNKANRTPACTKGGIPTHNKPNPKKERPNPHSVPTIDSMVDLFIKGSFPHQEKGEQTRWLRRQHRDIVIIFNKRIISSCPGGLSIRNG
jgi:hypothetical protein